MKHRFSKLTRARMAAFVAVAALFGTDAWGQGTGEKGQATNIVADAAKRVASEPAISAELRYKIDAFGHALIGTGNYLQSGTGPEKLLRLDLRMQVGNKPAIVQEIRGTDAYWVKRDVPPLPPSLGMVELSKLRRAVTQAAPAGTDVLPQGDWIMLGGLSRLLTALDSNFAFTQPRADELRFTATDGKSLTTLPIWIVSGKWKPEKLANLVEREPGKVGALPEQLPDQVELVLGRTEDLALFPYRITYWRTPKKEKNAAQNDPPAAPRELLTMEFFKISNDPTRINPRDFQYQPGDQDVQNLTQHYVERYTGDTKLR